MCVCLPYVRHMSDICQTYVFFAFLSFFVPKFWVKKQTKNTRYFVYGHQISYGHFLVNSHWQQWDLAIFVLLFFLLLVYLCAFMYFCFMPLWPFKVLRFLLVNIIIKTELLTDINIKVICISTILANFSTPFPNNDITHRLVIFPWILITYHGVLS